MRKALEENRNRILDFLLRDDQGGANLLDRWFLFTFLLLSYGFSSYVARPIRALALRLADSSRGGERYPVLPLKGDDEITLLTAEFNRLFKNLAEYDRHNADILAVEKTKVSTAGGRG